MKNLRILVFNWQDIKNPFGGGAEFHFHEIFKRIVAMGHSVTLYCSKFEGAPDEEYIDGIRIIREGDRNLFNFFVPMRYFRRFRQENYDIIIDNINKIPFYTPLYVREPLLCISHHFFGKSIFSETNPVFASYVYGSEMLISAVYKNSPFAVVSESTLQDFLKRGFDRKNFTIVYNGLTPSDYPMKVGEKNPFPTVTYFGRLKKYKSVDHLLRAFAGVQKQLPGARLFILGTGDFRPELEKLATTLGISSYVKFFGYVSNEEKISLLSRSHVAVNTSIKEGWGITNLEANACGTPIISSNSPGLRDSVKVGVSGLLYEYGDIQELQEKILSVLTDKSLQDRLSHGAIEWARNFDWDDSAKKMLEMCLKVVDTAGKSPRK